MGERGDFFAVDRRTWARVCGLGKVNPAVAYLVLARGTLGDMRTTAWSVNAIEERTSISNRAAKAAVQTLIDAGLIERRRGGRHPLYRIRSAEEIGAATKVEPVVLSPMQQAVLDAIRKYPAAVFLPRRQGLASGWPEGAPCNTARELVRLGLVRETKYQHFLAEAPAEPEPEAAPGADWIWLPNSIVDGADQETPPLERVRQSQSPIALRMFIELYHAHSLRDDSGVSWRMIREIYNRKKIAGYGKYDVYMFWPKKLEAWNTTPFIAPHLTGAREEISLPDGGTHTRDRGWPAIWDAVHDLMNARVLEFIPHLVEADTDEASLIYPLAGAGQGEEDERDLGAALREAARAMLTAAGKGHDYRSDVRLVPVERHLRQIAVVGVLRLRHRPRTTATAIWAERLAEWREAAAVYRELAGIEKAPPQSGNGVTRLPTATDINGRSTGDQRDING